METYRLYHNSIPFCDTDSYYKFIAAHIKGTSPQFYSVSKVHHINTISGSMFAVKITNDIENQDNDVLAECIINNDYYYVWRSAIWSIARDKLGRAASTTYNESSIDKIIRPQTTESKKLVIYKMIDYIN